MTKFYDVTFQELSGRSVVKTEVASDREPFDVWQDACASYSETELNIQINEDTFVTLNRHFVVRIDVKEVDGPVDKQVRRRDELMNVVNTLSNIKNTTKHFTLGGIFLIRIKETSQRRIGKKELRHLKRLSAWLQFYCFLCRAFSDVLNVFEADG